jgi:hypothetical protein
MNPIVKQQWIEALRSDSYKQGKDCLRDNQDNFCCLGVLCDVVQKKKAELPDVPRFVEWRYAPEQAEHDLPYVFAVSEGNTENQCSTDLYLPPALAKALKISENGFIKELKDKDCRDVNLALLNDEGLTFSQIADVIEYFF